MAWSFKLTITGPSCSHFKSQITEMFHCCCFPCFSQICIHFQKYESLWFSSCLQTWILLTSSVVIEGHYLPCMCPPAANSQYSGVQHVQHWVTGLSSMASGTPSGSSSCLASSLLISLSLCSLSCVWADDAANERLLVNISQLYGEILFK